MKTIDLKDKINNELKIPELFAKAISEKFDKPYEVILKHIQEATDKKIEKIEKTFSEIGQQEDIHINNPKNIEDFIGENKVIKG